MASNRQEPYWVRACPVCKRQLRVVTSQCCNGEFGTTIYCVPEDQHRKAVEALQAIYDRHHMAGDGSAGKVSGDALRALGIDPDAGSNDHGV